MARGTRLNTGWARLCFVFKVENLVCSAADLEVQSLRQGLAPAKQRTDLYKLKHSRAIVRTPEASDQPSHVGVYIV